MGILIEDVAFNKKGHSQLYRPDNTDLFNQAVSLTEIRPLEAIWIYREILSTDPNNPWVNFNLGTLYYNHRGFAEAGRYYTAAIASSPGWAAAHFNLGNVYDELGQFALAITEYKKAIALEQDYADAHYNLALTYGRAFYPRKAIPHWLKYTKLDRSGACHTFAAAALRELLVRDPLAIVYRNPNKK